MIPRDGSAVISVVIETGDDIALPHVKQVQEAIVKELHAQLAQMDGAVRINLSRKMGRRSIRFGPGAGALLDTETLQALLSQMAQQDRAHVILPLDNFSYLDGTELPRTAGTCFSVRTGADLIALALHPATKPAAREALGALHLDCQRMAQAMRCFTDREAEVAIIGPIKPHTWRYLEDEVACRVRVFADAGENAGGLAATLYRRATPADFLAWMGQMGQAIFLDSRQFLAGGPLPSELDFYWSDTGQVEAIQHPDLRRLTELALSAPYPFILGGPSLVNGALYTLVEAAWKSGPDLNRGYQIAW